MCDRKNRENFELFWNRPNSIGDVFGKCFGSILIQFSASGGCFEGRSDVFDASQRHFDAFGVPVARGWELPEAAGRSDV